MSDDNFLSDDETGVDNAETNKRDRRLNSNRVPCTHASTSLVARLINEVDGEIEQLTPRRRRRKAIDETTFAATVTALVCDLAHLCLLGDHERLAVGRGKDWTARYRTVVQNKHLTAVLDALAQGRLEYVREFPGHQQYPGQRAALTTLEPSQKFAELVASAGLTTADFATVPVGEVILLTRRDGSGQASRKVEVDYQDNAETHRLRDEMNRVNRVLYRTRLGLDEKALVDAVRPIDLSTRQLVRQFTQGNFGSGGRLWRGFWLDMSKADRDAAITIEGEPTAELDFGQTGVRIIYGMAGATVPDGDLYSLAPWFPEEDRDGIKKLMSAMLFRTEPLASFPRGTKSLFRRKTTKVTDVQQAILKAHAGIADLFFRGIGHQAQRVESDILVATLIALGDQNIPALPVHDAIIVPRSAASRARDVMLRVFRGLSGVDGRVSSRPPEALTP